MRLITNCPITRLICLYTIKTLSRTNENRYLGGVVTLLYLAYIFDGKKGHSCLPLLSAKKRQEEQNSIDQFNTVRFPNFYPLANSAECKKPLYFELSNQSDNKNVKQVVNLGQVHQKSNLFQNQKTFSQLSISGKTRRKQF